MLGPLDFGNNLPTVSVCQVEKRRKTELILLNFMSIPARGILPLDGDVILLLERLEFMDLRHRAYRGILCAEGNIRENESL